MRPELRRTFHDRLAGIHERVREIAEVVLQGLSEATIALLARDITRARNVIGSQSLLSVSASDIEAEVQDLIALQAPVGRDLRFLLASLRIAQELELCAGLVASVARRVGRIDATVMTPLIASVVDDMGASAATMLRKAVGGYAVLDGSVSIGLGDEADMIAELHRQLLSALFCLEGLAVEPAVELGLVGRFYERVSDHAVVIADRVYFAAYGVVNPESSGANRSGR